MQSLLFRRRSPGANSHLSELTGRISQFANGKRQLCRKLGLFQAKLDLWAVWEMTTATATKTPQFNDLTGWMRKINRAARFLAQIFDISARWRRQILICSDGNASSQQLMFHSLPLNENHSCRTSESIIGLFCSKCPTWNNRKALNLITQTSILKWGFRDSSRRSFNKLPCSGKMTSLVASTFLDQFGITDACHLRD